MSWRAIKAALVGAVACMAGLAAAGPAEADIRTFKVTAEGSGTYDRYDQAIDPFDGQLLYQNAVAASFSWRTTIPRISFDSETGKLVDGSASPSGRLSGSGDQQQVAYGRSGNTIVRTPGECSAASQDVSVNGGRVIVDLATPPPNEPGVGLIVRPFDEVRLAAACSGGLAGESRISIWEDKQPPDAFDHRFFLPKDATNQGLIVQHVEQQPDQRARCSMEVPQTESCTLDWSGKLTFELIEVIKTRPEPPSDDLLLPIDPAPEDVLLPLPKPKRDSHDDLLLPLDPELSPAGERASVKVSCPGGCAGTVSAHAVSGARATGSATAPLATVRFKAPAGKPKKVTLRFRGPARRAVRRAGAVRLVVQVGKRRRSVVARARG